MYKNKSIKLKLLIDKGTIPILVHIIQDGEIIQISLGNHNQWFLRCNKDQVTRMQLIGIHPVTISDPPQPTSSTHSSAFEEKVQQALKGLEMNTQLLHSHTQSIAKLETQIGQLATAFSRSEEGKLPSQPINNPKGQYMTESSTGLETFSEHAKSIMTLKSGKTLNQPEVTQQQEQPIPATIEKKKFEERKKPVNPVPAPKALFPSALESSLPLDMKGIKMNEMLELCK